VIARSFVRLLYVVFVNFKSIKTTVLFKLLSALATIHRKFIVITLSSNTIHNRPIHVVLVITASNIEYQRHCFQQFFLS